MAKQKWTISPYAPDPFPYSLVIQRGTRSYGFVCSPMIQWSGSQVNQKATRFQNGPRQITDMTMLNTHAWSRLSDGGTGAKSGSDETRYRYASNVFVGDTGEIKLSPAYTTSPLTLAAGEEIRKVITWVGPKVQGGVAAGVGDEMIILVVCTPTSTRLFHYQPTNDIASPTPLSYHDGSSLVSALSVQVTDAVIHRNKLYLACDATHATQGYLRAISWDQANTRFKIEIAPGNVRREKLHSDGQYLVASLGNDVYRSLDPMLGSVAVTGNLAGAISTTDTIMRLTDGKSFPQEGIVSVGTEKIRYRKRTDNEFIIQRGIEQTTAATAAANAGVTLTAPTNVWTSAVPVGFGSPVTGLLTYGADADVAIYATTWDGIWRIPEEQDEDGRKMLRRAYPIDVRPGSADNYLGKVFTVTNNEIVASFARGLLRHTLGQTTLQSPWDDDGTPPVQRGYVEALQDGIGGIYLAINPITASGRPWIARWQQGRMHDFLTITQNTITKIRGLFWTSRQHAPTARLWIIYRDTAVGYDQVAYIPMPSNTTNYRLLSTTQYVGSGSIEFPIFEGEFSRIPKSWIGVRVNGRPGNRAGIGLVSTFYSTEPYLDSPTLNNRGQFTLVPDPADVTKMKWLPLQVGTPNSRHVVINETSLAISVSLSLGHSVGAAYPDTGLLHPKGLLHQGKLIVWGELPVEGSRPLTDLTEWHVLRWNQLAEVWERQDVTATTIAGARKLNSNLIVFAGTFIVGGITYGAVTLDAVTGAVAGIEQFRDAPITKIADSQLWVHVIASFGGSYRHWRTTKAGFAENWEAGASMPTDPNWVCGIGTNILIIQGPASLTQNATVLNGASKTYASFADNMATAPAAITWSGATLAEYEAYVFTAEASGYTTFFASSPVTGQNTLHTVTLSGSTLTVTWTTTTGLPAAQITTAEDSSSIVLIGFASGQVYEWTGSAWRQLVGVSTTTATITGVGSIVKIGAFDLFVIGDYRSSNTPVYDVFGGNVGYGIRVAQALYVPRFDNVAAPRNTPVLDQVALDYLDTPPFLRAYTMTLELKDDVRLLDGTQHPRSTLQQLNDLIEIARSNELVKVITPDFSKVEGFISGLRWNTMDHQRAKTTDAPYDVSYTVTLTITEALPMETNMGSGYVAPE